MSPRTRAPYTSDAGSYADPCETAIRRMAEKPSSAVEPADIVSELMYALAGWILIGLGAFGVIGTTLSAMRNPSVVAVPLFLLSALFVVFGVFVNPRFRRRLDRRRAIDQFGRVQTVESGVLRSEHGRTEQCVVCGSGTDEGLVRRYREEFVAAGIPVYTLSEGYNYYCPACATTDETGPSRETDPMADHAGQTADAKRPETGRT